MSTFTLIAIVIVVAVIAYGVYASIQAGRARTKELAALAPLLGMTFVGELAPTSPATGDPRDDYEALRAAFGNFRRFSGTMRPRVSNWMRGEKDGMRVSLFDYFDGGARQRDIVSTHTLVSLEHPSLQLPSFSLAPIPGRYVVPFTRASQALAGLVGLAGADVEVDMSAHPDFEDQYLLRGHDEAAVRRAFGDRVTRFFQDNPGWMVEGDGARLLLNRMSPDEVRTYWRGAVPPSDVAEIAAAASAVKDGPLGEKLTAAPGVRPAELRSFLSSALEVAGAFM